jgi:hypothetical protein
MLQRSAQKTRKIYKDIIRIGGKTLSYLWTPIQQWCLCGKSREVGDCYTMYSHLIIGCGGFNPSTINQPISRKGASMINIPHRVINKTQGSSFLLRVNTLNQHTSNKIVAMPAIKIVAWSYKYWTVPSNKWEHNRNIIINISYLLPKHEGVTKGLMGKLLINNGICPNIYHIYDIHMYAFFFFKKGSVYLCKCMPGCM